jgi:hypothetical protein
MAQSADSGFRTSALAGEMLELLANSRIPDKNSFQSAVESMGAQLQLDSTLDLIRDPGLLFAQIGF